MIRTKHQGSSCQSAYSNKLCGPFLTIKLNIVYLRHLHGNHQQVAKQETSAKNLFCCARLTILTTKNIISDIFFVLDIISCMICQLSVSCYPRYFNKHELWQGSHALISPTRHRLLHVLNACRASQSSPRGARAQRASNHDRLLARTRMTI